MNFSELQRVSASLFDGYDRVLSGDVMDFDWVILASGAGNPWDRLLAICTPDDLELGETLSEAVEGWEAEYGTSLDYCFASELRRHREGDDDATDEEEAWDEYEDPAKYW